MPGISTTGWDSKALSDIQDEISEALWATISPTLNLSETSLLGQFIGSTASNLRQLWEAGGAIYASIDPDQAEGDALGARARLSGTDRKPATPSTALMTITLTATGGSPAGTYAAGTLRVAVSGNPELVFANDEDIVVGGTVTLTDQAFTCVTEGAFPANANTITEIANPITGFSSPTNPAKAVTGTNEELDSALRLRRVQSLARKGSATVDAIRADVLEVDSVAVCKVIENDTDSAVSGQPAHTVACYVLGGDDTDVAEAIFNAKAAGVGTYGATSATVTDSQGGTHSVSFTRPTEVPLFVAVTVTAITGQYPASDDETVENQVFNWRTAWNGTPNTAESDTSNVGEDVIINQMRAAIMRAPGVIDITALAVDTVDPPVNTANITINTNQYADIDFVDIDVTVNYVSAAP